MQTTLHDSPKTLVFFANSRWWATPILPEICAQSDPPTPSNTRISEILTDGLIWWANMHQHAKSNAYRSSQIARLRPSAILDFQKSTITCPSDSGPNLHDHAKFDVDRSTSGQHMPDFRFLQMAAAHHLEFLKAQNFNWRSDLESQYASPCQISCGSVKPLPRYA